MASAETGTLSTRYTLDDQVGYLLRLASQRHAAIFQKTIAQDLTPTQFSTLLRLHEAGEVSQNQLGRLAAIDIATIKGVVDRLRDKSLIETRPDPGDKRRSLISLSQEGRDLIATLERVGTEITEATLAPLDAAERTALIALLRKIT
ncbi:MarR family winged helix-turn-helix transcriptional regulator [Litorisediminicola beolgyonensis]|uniref:MarR family winged helix-turn-helix transcriptional regulator n=1 Tax=Litorisediminicola beolgyonensis TaxID=1173614 RepID=A0ABW3ZIG1_9RHOB